MKKLIALILILTLLTVFLASCGNENLGFGNFTYTHARIGLAGDGGQCVDIQSWHDNEIGIELHLKNGDGIYCSEGTYILFKDKNACPYC